MFGLASNTEAACDWVEGRHYLALERKGAKKMAPHQLFPLRRRGARATQPRLSGLHIGVISKRTLLRRLSWRRDILRGKVSTAELKQDGELRDDRQTHKAPITILQWSPKGSLLVSGTRGIGGATLSAAPCQSFMRHFFLLSLRSAHTCSGPL